MDKSFFTACLKTTLGLSLVAFNAAAGQRNTVYVMDNAAAANHVLVFGGDQNGPLQNEANVPTGGVGTGAGLSSQGSMSLSHDGRWLFVCNAGSDDISVFSVGPHGLRLTDRVSSGGHLPVSLSLHRNLLYVLNAGGSAGSADNVNGFFFVDGRLVALPESTRALSGDNTSPTEVSFSQDGNSLIVTEKGTSLIDVFVLGDEGVATAHKVFQSAGAAPFGFAVGRDDRLFVSEAAGVPNGSSASSYNLSDSGDLELITGPVATEQQAACWLTLSHDQHFAYTANAASGTISAFGIDPDGGLHLLPANGISGVTGMGSHPVDMSVSRDGRSLFALANGNGTLGTFQVRSNGELGAHWFATGLPTSAAGLAAR
jgi:6-phosphogluconolactonase